MQWVKAGQACRDECGPEVAEHVYAGYVPGHLRDLASDQPGATGNIEDLVCGSDIGRFDQEPLNPRVVASIASVSLRAIPLWRA